MPFDFNTPVDRRNTQSVKWNVGEHELPMWIADMDFASPPEVVEAVRRRAEHGVFGYNFMPDTWREAIAGWWARRHGFSFDPNDLLFAAGVVPAVASIIRRLTNVGENIVLQTPAYNAFFPTITNNGRHVLENPMLYENGQYRLDFDDLEYKLSSPQTTMLILCNPHNPAGKIWSRGELARIGELCEKHHVLVLADEIHCDLTDPGCEYTPYASVNETCRQNSVTCMAPTKTFNLAGLQSAAAMVPNEALRSRVRAGFSTDGITGLNAFAADATIAAYTHGDAWLDALRAYLYENKITVRTFLADQLPQLRLTPSQATYLLWLDCGALPGDKSGLAGFIREKTGLFLSAGSAYGDPNFLRMNIACPRILLQDGLARLKKGIEAFEKENQI